METAYDMTDMTEYEDDSYLYKISYDLELAQILWQQTAMIRLLTSCLALGAYIRLSAIARTGCPVFALLCLI